MKRWEFITLLGSVAFNWPLTASAQQTAMPVVGSPAVTSHLIETFKQGSHELGWLEGQNVIIALSAASLFGKSHYG